MIFNAFNLSKTLSDKMGFVPLNGIICSMFNYEHPFTVYQSFARRQSSKSLVIGNNSLSSDQYLLLQKKKAPNLD